MTNSKKPIGDISNLSKRNVSIPGNADHLIDLVAPPPGLTKAECQEFEAMFRAICADVDPTNFIERNWCRNIASSIWRLHQLDHLREEFIQSRYDLALAFLLVERTSEDVLDLKSRIRDGDGEAAQRIEDLKTKFGITDAQLRSEIETRYRNELSRIDQEIRMLEISRDRIIEFIEKRRFMKMANLRLAAELPKRFMSDPDKSEGA